MVPVARANDLAGERPSATSEHRLDRAKGMSGTKNRMSVATAVDDQREHDRPGRLAMLRLVSARDSSSADRMRTRLGRGKNARYDDGQEVRRVEHRAQDDDADGNHWSVCMAPVSMNHLPRKPAVGGRPIMLRAPMAKARHRPGHAMADAVELGLISVLWAAV